MDRTRSTGQDGRTVFSVPGHHSGDDMPSGKYVSVRSGSLARVADNEQAPNGEDVGRVVPHEVTFERMETEDGKASYLKRNDDSAGSLTAGYQSLGLGDTFRTHRSSRRYENRPARRRARTHAESLGYVMDGLESRIGEFTPRDRELSDGLEQSEQPSMPHKKLLSKKGDTVENISMAIYDQLHEEQRPNFLPHVQLMEDGGLSRVSEIWTSERIFWCLFLYASVAFNVVSICMLDWMIFQNYLGIICLKIEEASRQDIHNPGKFLFATFNAEVEQGQLEVFSQITDPGMRRSFETLGALVATAEILFLLSFFCRIANEFYVFASYILQENVNAQMRRRKRFRKEYVAFKTLHSLLQVTLPQLSTFSALKMVGRVHPSMIYNEYIDYIQESANNFCGGKLGNCSVLVATAWFVFTRILCGGVALIAFAVKLLAVGFKLVHPARFNWFLRWSQVVSLLSQCMGAILFERVLQDRLFLFLFGGSDMEYQDTERALRNVYQCRLTKQIWSEMWAKGERCKAFVLLSTLDHYDLQALIIRDEDDWHEYAEGTDLRFATVATIDERQSYW